MPVVPDAVAKSIPESMRAELGAWNAGQGIELEGWVGCSGSFSLAVGYAAVFWPDFELVEDHVLLKGASLDTFKRTQAASQHDRAQIECFLNHFHIADVQHYGCGDISADKLVYLGNRLAEMYRAKLAFDFPDRRFKVEFLVPDRPDDFYGYQISFWQSD